MNYESNDYHSLKMKQHLLLLRRPLPPKLSKLQIHTRKIRTATTDETTSVKIRKRIFHDVVSKYQSQRPLSIHNIFFESEVQGRVSSTSSFPRAASSFSWKISHSAAGSVFFPVGISASFHVFRKKRGKRKKKSKKKKHKKEKTSGDVQMGNMLVISTRNLRPLITTYSDITSKFKTLTPKYHHLQEIPDYTQGLSPILKDLSVTSLSPVSINKQSSVPEKQWTEHFQYKSSAISKVPLKMAKLPAISSLPPPVLPRKPQRQAAIESMVEIGKTEISPGQPEDFRMLNQQPCVPAKKPTYQGVVKPRRILDPEAHVLRGEGFNTVTATRNETILAVSNLAIINCQIHGRNALNLQGFCLQQCPDLTPLAFQLIYLNLSFNLLSQFPIEVLCLPNLQILKLRNNPITEIPNDIRQLKFLRSFTIAFNKIKTLPHGLFYLIRLEELDISYNEITEIPNEIYKLRSLDKFIVDGNYMTSFPPGILELDLTKIQYENTFTCHHFWAENSLNSPQCLKHIVALFIVKNNLHTHYPKIQRYIISKNRCDWCRGPRFGKGLHIIRSCNIFGATELPIMFSVCSSACYVDIRESNFILEGFPTRKIPLNMDWVKQRKASDATS